MQTTQLLSSLSETTKSLIIKTENFNSLSNDQLNKRLGKKSWSILECLEHLNLYGDYYLPEIERAIRKATQNLFQFLKAAGWAIISQIACCQRNS